MRLKSRQSTAILIAGLILIVFGAWVTAFVVDTSGYLKIYFAATKTSIQILEISPEFRPPLAGIQPYIQNLTMGARILTVVASINGILVLNQTYSGIGEGYDVKRTGLLSPAPRENSNVSVTLRLFENGSLVSESSNSTMWGRDYLWQIIGVLSVVTGGSLILANVRLTGRGRKKRSVTRGSRSNRRPSQNEGEETSSQISRPTKNSTGARRLR